MYKYRPPGYSSGFTLGEAGVPLHRIAVEIRDLRHASQHSCHRPKPRMFKGVFCCTVICIQSRNTWITIRLAVPASEIKNVKTPCTNFILYWSFVIQGQRRKVLELCFNGTCNCKERRWNHLPWKGILQLDYGLIPMYVSVIDSNELILVCPSDWLGVFGWINICMTVQVNGWVDCQGWRVSLLDKTSIQLNTHH